MRPLHVLVTAGGRAVEVRRLHDDTWSREPVHHDSPIGELTRLADTAGDGWIAWLDRRLEPFLSTVSNWPSLVRHPLEVLHAGGIDRPDIAAASLGYVDFDSLYFFPPAAARRSPMWFISAAAGVASASALRAIGMDSTYDFAAAMIDLGSRGVRAGLCVYSEPALVAGDIPAADAAALRARLTPSQVALLARRLYGRQWVLFWLANSLLYARSLPLWPAVKAWRHAPATPPGQIDETMLAGLAPARQAADRESAVHVIVPTLGRPHSVGQLLDDLAAQTHPPRSVAIIEQQPGGGESALSHIVSRAWPFEVMHRSVAWTGACRARNDGLDLATGQWILFLDDDVRLPPRFVEHALSVARTYGAEVVTALVRSPTTAQSTENRRPHFTSVLPTCATLVSQAAADAIGPFDLRLEGGWGEDFEYGLRLRKTGATMLRTPDEPVLHLHEPSGGFRSPLLHPWDHDKVSPRPSPTVLLSRRGLPRTMQQGHRLYYVLKRLSGVPWYRALAELTVTTRQWRAATQWANRLASLDCRAGRPGH
jgi:hypothetical protein